LGETVEVETFIIYIDSSLLLSLTYQKAHDKMKKNLLDNKHFFQRIQVKK